MDAFSETFFELALLCHLGPILCQLPDGVVSFSRRRKRTFATRRNLLKIAARVTKTATRIRFALAGACPQAASFSGIARRLPLADP